MTTQLPDWAQDLMQALEISDAAPHIDHEALAALAQKVDTPELVGFIAGYAAGVAEGAGMADFPRAHNASLGFMTSHLTSLD